jgi:putative transposase
VLVFPRVVVQLVRLKTGNQRIHQMLHDQGRHLLAYKAERLGLTVVLQDERYTSQTSPACGKRHKPRRREYRCACGCRYHRDGVDALNIRNKYRQDIAVIGDMAPPIGQWYTRHSRCSLEHVR